MIGHGLRYLALQAAWNLETATFVGGLAVGIMSTWMAREYKTPFAVIGFAGAVTMMPGLQIYRTLSGGLKLARSGGATEPPVEMVLSNALQASLIICALALGLIVANRAVTMIARSQESTQTVSA
jgi:uncharacterized membrane protein YjjB (DUF3815 family)